MAIAARLDLPRRKEAHAPALSLLPAPGMLRPVGDWLRAGAAGLPRWIRPQLTALVDAAPEGDQWLHEIKFDGCRMHARRDPCEVRLLTCTGLGGTHK